MDKALTWFIRIWVGFAMLVNVIAMAGFFVAHGFWGGLAKVQETYSPFNIWNYFAELLLLSPALIAYWWREKRRTKRDLIKG
jgi:hypothetical protein